MPYFDYLDNIWNKANKTKLGELDILYKKQQKLLLTMIFLNVIKSLQGYEVAPTPLTQAGSYDNSNFKDY